MTNWKRRAKQYKWLYKSAEHDCTKTLELYDKVITERNTLTESLAKMTAERDFQTNLANGLLTENTRLREVLKKVRMITYDKPVVNLIDSILTPQKPEPVKLRVENGNLMYGDVEITTYLNNFMDTCFIHGIREIEHLKDNPDNHEHAIIVNGERIPVTRDMFESEESHE